MVLHHCMVPTGPHRLQGCIPCHRHNWHQILAMCLGPQVHGAEDARDVRRAKGFLAPSATLTNLG